MLKSLFSSHNYSIDVGTENLLSKWNHFSITWIKLLHIAKFYLNGKEIASYTFTAVTDSDIELPSGSVLEIMASISGKISLTYIKLWIRIFLLFLYCTYVPYLQEAELYMLYVVYFCLFYVYNWNFLKLLWHINIRRVLGKIVCVLNVELKL